MTGNNRLAAAGVLVVLCLGTLVSAEGTFSSLVGGERHFDYFPFLRRYQPAASFPLFLLLLIIVWSFLTKRVRPVLSGLLVGVCLALLVFSYFYLWTAALAWLGILAGLWLICRPGDRRFVIKLMMSAGIVLATALVPYLILISHGANTTTSVQALVSSRKPDLFAAAEIFAFLVLAVLAAGVSRGAIAYHDPPGAPRSVSGPSTFRSLESTTNHWSSDAVDSLQGLRNKLCRAVGCGSHDGA